MSNNIEISLVLPTRSRPELVARLLESIAQTAERPDRMEVVLYLDRDDTPSHQIDHPSLRLVKIIGPPAKMGVMTRACFTKSIGRYVMLINDDVICRTARWDTVILDAFGRFADDVALVWCDDRYRGSAIPSFPALSRKVCELMGSICPAGYSRDYIDTHIFDIFKKLSAMGHDRLVYLPSIVIEHMHHEAGKGRFDTTYIKARQQADELTFIAWDERRQIIADDLASCIEQGNQCDS